MPTCSNNISFWWYKKSKCKVIHIVNLFGDTCILQTSTVKSYVWFYKNNVYSQIFIITWHILLIDCKTSLHWYCIWIKSIHLFILNHWNLSYRFLLVHLYNFESYLMVWWSLFYWILFMKYIIKSWLLLFALHKTLAPSWKDINSTVWVKSRTTGMCAS